MKVTPTEIGRRVRQLRHVWKVEGARGVADRIRHRAADRLKPKATMMPVCRTDVLAADLSMPKKKEWRGLEPTSPFLINWVIVPPVAGEGGPSTLFRIINYLGKRGYKNRVYFYDVYRTDHQYHASILRQYYGFDGPVIPLREGMMDAHAVVASSWATAYPVFNASAAGKRFYFVQDFEPFFHPVGSLSALAENTYRMGFHAITAGSWLAQKLRVEYAMEADHFEFGCDISRYRLLPGSRRNGVAFYARSETPRRAVELGTMAFEILAERRPGIELHFFGNKLGKLSYQFIDHGHVSPDQLNAIYNRCRAGLCLSLTNPSLVPLEMLACGCIPVVNDAEHNRFVLNNPFIRSAALDPHSLAALLDSLLNMEEREASSQSRLAAASVDAISWDQAGAAVDRIFRRTLGDENR